jgi:hypothetical protein
MISHSMTLAAGLALALWSGAASAVEPSPYASHVERPVKALSAERIAALYEGAGQGYALAAELNGYPGPRHVLDLAEPLGLHAGQRTAVEALFTTMREEARALGAELVRQEAALERAFQNGTINAGRLAEATAEISAVEGRLRAVHLRYHIDTRALLSGDQLAAYHRLRGYTASDGRGTGASRQHGGDHAH